jgi:LPXTG-motif cell wall-anchored protein
VTARPVGRALAVLGAALLLTVLSSGPAAAHNQLASSDPADGAALDRTPEAVLLTFTEPAVSLGTEVVVTGPDGAAADGPPQLVDATVRQPLLEGAPAGTYTVDWRVTSTDGHPIAGRLSFTSAAPGTGTYTGPAQSPAPVETGSPAWAWLALTAGLLAAAGALAVRRRRRRPVD